MSLLGRTRTLLVLACTLIGVAVWVSGTFQRNSADRHREIEVRAQEMLTAMLDQETGVRGFLISGREDFLEPWQSGRALFDDAVTELRDELTEEDAVDALGSTVSAAQTWQSLASDVVDGVRARGPRNAESVASALARKQLFDAFRQAHTHFGDVLAEDRRHDTRVATIAAALVSLLIALLIASLGALVISRQVREVRRRRAEERAQREAQVEFVETMQLADDEHEAHDLLRRHLERTLDGGDVLVLNRNNSADRLEPVTRVQDSDLAERLEGAHPRSCLAVRLGRENTRGASGEQLLECELCGKCSGATVCRPLLVGSEVIGSVLAMRQEPFDDRERERLRDTVSQAAPALANLRNLALAERRAATDVLTGLPNRRSIDDTAKRMVAQASRTAQPLSCLMIDLDHFKTINDLYGHEAGDDVLAGVGGLLQESLRASDFAGRHGGEEFMVLAPATDSLGALKLAENLRLAVEQLQVPAIEHRLSASIGVATLPDVANNGTTLFRMADRALYAAKELGRNRVETAHAPGTRGAAELAPD